MRHRLSGQEGRDSRDLNSSELRAVQGHQKNDFILNPINPPLQREQKSRSAKVQELI